MNECTLEIRIALLGLQQLPCSLIHSDYEDERGKNMIFYSTSSLQGFWLIWTTSRNSHSNDPDSNVSKALHMAA